MTTICPTITADNPHTYRTQIERVAPFATRLHIDISDGIFSPQKLVDIPNIWWPGGVRADLHVMVKYPFVHFDLYRALGPQLVIVHIEAEGDFVRFSEMLHSHGIEVGVALLQETPADAITDALDLIDHVLIFSGKLGYFGGKADPKLLDKVAQLKKLKPTLEIGWDGGINDMNASLLAKGGVDVLNVGGFIQRSHNPEKAYESLVQAIVQ